MLPLSMGSGEPSGTDEEDWESIESGDDPSSESGEQSKSASNQSALELDKASDS